MTAGVREETRATSGESFNEGQQSSREGRADVVVMAGGTRHAPGRLTGGPGLNFRLGPEVCQAICRSWPLRARADGIFYVYGWRQTGKCVWTGFAGCLRAQRSRGPTLVHAMTSSFCHRGVTEERAVSQGKKAWWERVLRSGLGDGLADDDYADIEEEPREVGQDSCRVRCSACCMSSARQVLLAAVMYTALLLPCKPARVSGIAPWFPHSDIFPFLVCSFFLPFFFTLFFQRTAASTY